MEYVGLALVISMVTAAVASAVDSAFGQHLARTLLEHLVHSISGPGSGGPAGHGH